MEGSQLEHTSKLSRALKTTNDGAPIQTFLGGDPALHWCLENLHK